MPEQYPSPAPQGPVEYLGEDGTTPARRGRARTGLVAGGAAAVVALGAAGAWGVASFMSGGQEAADVVPSDALAYVSLDLDPDGGQKLEAYQTLKKFPALADRLQASGDDLRRALVESILEDVDCPGITFDDDVAPWLGSSLAVAAVPGDDEPEPVGFLQVTDEDAAAKGLAALTACSPGDDDEMSGTAFGDGWLVVAKTDAKAQAALDDAASGSLADDADYQRWVEEAGGSGIVTAYVAAAAPLAVLEAIDGNLATREASPGVLLSTFHEQGDPDLETVKGLFADFDGGAAVVRFEDESLELETAVGGLPQFTTPGGDSGIGDLPDTTGVAFGLAVGDTFVQDLLDAYAEGAGQAQTDQFLQQAEQMTGLELPEDLQALLGDGVAVALDGSADFSAEGKSSPLAIPVGLRIKGDADTIVPAVDKVLGALSTFAGVPEGFVQVQKGDDAVGIALTEDRAAELAGDGGLGDQDGFADALPDLDRSGSGLYVGFDDGGWFSSLVAQAGDDEVTANVEPLHGLGVTGWSEDGTSHGLLRLTTD